LDTVFKIAKQMEDENEKSSDESGSEDEKVKP
jgi:hypothetical protein